MNFSATPIPGVVASTTPPHRDARGSFARLYCPDEFAAADAIADGGPDVATKVDEALKAVERLVRS